MSHMLLLIRSESWALSSIYEEANHPVTLDLGVLFCFCGGAGEQEGTSKNTSGRYNGTMVIVHLSHAFYSAIDFLKAK